MAASHPSVKRKDLPGIDHGDSYNCVFRAPDLGKYVLFTRYWGGSGAVGGRYGEGRFRMVSRSESPDFLNWSKAEVVLCGQVKVTLLDEENNKLAESELITENVTDTEVQRPQGYSFSRVRGNKIRLTFGLRDAKLYSLSFK